ncbi:MAG: hypothetical protein AAFX41_14155, partial [Bacteroidota bacterium]
TFPLVPLADVLEPRDDRVEPEDFAAFSPITIRFGGTIEPRDRTTPFAGTMRAAYPGDLVFSKIDLRNGAIGLLAEAVGPAVVTSEYPIYVPDADAVDAAFLALLLRTAPFQAQLRALASGTSGRKRIHPRQFEALEVPLPDVDEQQRLVAAHAAAHAEADRLAAEADRTEAAAVQAFEAALGLTPPPDLPQQRSRIARFADLDRWSHEGALHASEISDIEASVEVVRLGDVVADLKNGWSPQCLARPAGIDEWGVLKVGAVSSGYFRPEENKALPSKLDPISEIEVRAGDVLIGRANVLRLVGAAAFVRESRSRLMLCDKIFRVEFDPDVPIDSEYLVAVLQTPAVRQQIELAATGTSPTMKNISKLSLLDLSIPLPESLSEQRRLAQGLVEKRASASHLRSQAVDRRSEADAQFAEVVFG